MLDALVGFQNIVR